MPVLASEPCCHECTHYFEGQLFTNHACSQTKYIAVVVLARLMCRIGVVAQSGANSSEFICGHGGAYTTTAHQNPNICGATLDGFSDCLCIVGIVVNH